MRQMGFAHALRRKRKVGLNQLHDFARLLDGLHCIRFGEMAAG